MTIKISLENKKITRNKLKVLFQLSYSNIPAVGLTVGEVGFTDGVQLGSELGTKHLDIVINLILGDIIRSVENLKYTKWVISISKLAELVM